MIKHTDPFEDDISFEANIEMRKALAFMRSKMNHLLILGKAGTGKSTLIQHFKCTTNEKVALVAPTGVAALHIHGQTIHSLFRFPPHVAPTSDLRLPEGAALNLLQALDILIIDEISMVRADLLDCIDASLRMNRKNSAPFGGVQLVMTGDLFQLPPVLTFEEEEAFLQKYKGPHFFHAQIMKDLCFNTITFDKVYRQQDEKYLELLNVLRDGTITDEQIAEINSFCLRAVDLRAQPRMSIVPTNRAAQGINSQEMEDLKEVIYTNIGDVKGVPISHLPTDVNLPFCLRARVMCLINSKKIGIINGDLGWITHIDTKEPSVTIQLDRGHAVVLTEHIWEFRRYVYNRYTREIDSEVNGHFIQFPFKLAWATTIHKLQGQTFNELFVDLDQGTFANGQAYVALSRCRTLDGLRLRRPLERKHILVDPSITNFLQEVKRKESHEILSKKKTLYTDQDI